jgi:hypothetical protein
VDKYQLEDAFSPYGQIEDIKTVAGKECVNLCLTISFDTDADFRLVLLLLPMIIPRMRCMLLREWTASD